MLKEARRQIAEAMETRNELGATVLGSDKAAKRFAAFLGFFVDGEEGRRAETRLGRRMLVRYLDSEPDVREPIGGTYLVQMKLRKDRD